MRREKSGEGGRRDEGKVEDLRGDDGLTIRRLRGEGEVGERKGRLGEE